MSDHLSSLDASDSGFLNAFVGPQRFDPAQRGVQSRVGSEGAAVDAPDLTEQLRDVPIPDGLQNRLNRIADEG